MLRGLLRGLQQGAAGANSPTPSNTPLPFGSVGFRALFAVLIYPVDNPGDDGTGASVIAAMGATGAAASSGISFAFSQLASSTRGSSRELQGGVAVCSGPLCAGFVEMGAQTGKSVAALAAGVKIAAAPILLPAPRPNVGGGGGNLALSGAPGLPPLDGGGIAGVVIAALFAFALLAFVVMQGLAKRRLNTQAAQGQEVETVADALQSPVLRVSKALPPDSADHLEASASPSSVASSAAPPPSHTINPLAARSRLLRPPAAMGGGADNLAGYRGVGAGRHVLGRQWATAASGPRAAPSIDMSGTPSSVGALGSATVRSLSITRGGSPTVNPLFARALALEEARRLQTRRQ
jgi:hypothetical protein